MSNARPSWLPRKRLYLPLTIVAIFLAMSLLASAAAPPNVDTFADPSTSATITALPGSPTTSPGTPVSVPYSDSGAGNILGTQRDATVQVMSGAFNASATFSGSSGGNNMSISVGDATTGRVTLTYDGTANTTVGLCTGGVGSGCPSLIDGGKTNAFNFSVNSDDNPADLTVTVWNGNSAGANCTRTFSKFFPGGFALPVSPARKFALDYAAILAGTCSGTVTDLFAHVGKVEFVIEGVALDMTLDFMDLMPMDYGDLPETTAACATVAGSPYATTAKCEGPRHLVQGDLFLGATVDPKSGIAGESDGQPSSDAKGDDNADSDDEDGVTPVRVTGGTPECFWKDGTGGGKVSVKVTGTGRLVGWIDWNGTGFTSSDNVISKEITAAGDGDGRAVEYSFDVPSGTFASCTQTLYARFRLFPTLTFVTGTPYRYAYDGRNLELDAPGGDPYYSVLAINPPGRASNGEVEDYKWNFTPLAVDLASFTAAPQADHVLVAWETVSEFDNAGFNLYRATAADGVQTQVNPKLIPALAPGSTDGQAYTWQDSDVAPGQTYFYWLEDVDLNGTRTMHGPVSATYAPDNGTAAKPTSVHVQGLAAGPVGAALPWVGALLLALGGGTVIWRRRH